jgi:hypothetical protein
VTENRFEVCCIPFFLYGIALGDEVQTGLRGEQQYMVQRVAARSGRQVFRAWFTDPACRLDVADDLNHLGCLMEWRWEGSNLLAIDAESDALAKSVMELLEQRREVGQLEYESGQAP